MKKTLLWFLGLTLIVLLTGMFVYAQKKEEKGKTKAGQQQMSPEMKASMDAMAKAAAPGKYHKYLEAYVGKWNAEVKMWMNPGGKPDVSKGVSENKMILGGRFLYQDYTGEAMGSPFAGIGITGYDNVIKKYTFIWIDSMGTGMMTGDGTCDATGKVMTSVYLYNDPMTGKSKNGKEIGRLINKDKHVFEMYDKAPDGKEFKGMEITYTRTK